MRDIKIQNLLDQVFANPSSSQEELNAVLIQAVIDLNARVIQLEPKQHEFKVCADCGSEYVTGAVLNDNDEAEYYCRLHLFGE